jgi:hypothetical protein
MGEMERKGEAGGKQGCAQKGSVCDQRDSSKN